MSTYDDDPTQPPEDLFDDEHLEANYRRLSEVLSDYRTASEAPPETQSGLKSRIMDIVNKEALRGPSTELITPKRRTYQVTTSAIRAEVRAVIDSFGDLRARSVKLEEISAEASQFSVGAGFTMAPHVAVQELIPHLRRGIADRLHTVFGIDAAAIDLQVEDIHED